ERPNLFCDVSVDSVPGHNPTILSFCTASSPVTRFLLRNRGCKRISLIHGLRTRSPSTLLRNDGYKIRPSSSARRWRDDAHTATRGRLCRRRILLRLALNNYTALDRVRRSHVSELPISGCRARQHSHGASCGSDPSDNALPHRSTCAPARAPPPGDAAARG